MLKSNAINSLAILMQTGQKIEMTGSLIVDMYLKCTKVLSVGVISWCKAVLRIAVIN